MDDRVIHDTPSPSALKMDMSMFPRGLESHRRGWSRNLAAIAFAEASRLEHDGAAMNHGEGRLGPSRRLARGAGDGRRGADNIAYFRQRGCGGCDGFAVSRQGRGSSGEVALRRTIRVRDLCGGTLAGYSPSKKGGSRQHGANPAPHLGVLSGQTWPYWWFGGLNCPSDMVLRGII